MALTNYNPSAKQRALTQAKRHAEPSYGQPHQQVSLQNRHAGSSPLDGMMHRHQVMMKEVDSMVGNLLQPFGKDPFANDPFFNQGFGSMGKMMDNMHKEMQMAMAQPMEARMEGMKGGRFHQMQSVTSTKIDSNGRPVRETYQTKAQGAFGGGNRVSERHQMYENTGNGHQKMAHERTMNGQGRKVVQQRLGGPGGPQESRDLFQNLQPAAAQAFDRDWDSMAGVLGFDHQRNRLGYANSHSDARQNDPTWNHPAQPNPRGHYLPQHAHAEDAPVRINRGASDNLGRDRRQIEPTVPGSNIHQAARGRGAPGNRGQASNAAPLALPSSNQASAPRRAAAPQNQNAAAARVHRVPRQPQKQPARAG